MGNFTDAMQAGFGGAVGGAPGAILDAGMGLILGKYNDRRQLRQQQKLQDMQIKGQQQMMDYSMASQLKMWHDTNYSAQMEELKKAGLNEGLVYGMKGGGGTTTGAANGSVNGASAPSGGGEIQAMMGMGIQRAQLGLLEAQKANIEADTANKQADTQNKPLEGQQTIAQTNSILQGINNAKVQERIQNIDLALKEKTFDDAADRIAFEAGKAQQELEQAMADTYVSRETQVARANAIQEKAVGAMLENFLLRAQTDQTKQMTAESKAKIQKMAADIAQGWKGLDIEQQRATIQQKLMEYDTTINPYVKEGLKVLTQAVDGVLRRGTRNKMTTTERYSDKDGYSEETRREKYY